MHKVRHHSIANNPRSNLAHQFCMEKVAFPVAQDMVHSLFYDQVQDNNIKLATLISSLWLQIFQRVSRNHFIVLRLQKNFLNFCK